MIDRMFSLVQAFRLGRWVIENQFQTPSGGCRENRISPCKLRVLRVSVLKLLRKRSTTEARRARRSTKTGFSRQTPLESGLNNQFCSDRLQRFDPPATAGCSNNLSVSYRPVSRPFATTPRNRSARTPRLEILRSDRRCSDKQRGAME